MPVLKWIWNNPIMAQETDNFLQKLLTWPDIVLYVCIPAGFTIYTYLEKEVLGIQVIYT